MAMKKKAAKEKKVKIETPIDISRDECLKMLKDAGVEFDPVALQFMRLPATMTKGVNEKLEFYDNLSLQPEPYKKEDSPFEAKEIPAWIQRRYIGIRKKGKETTIVFIDAQRRTFAKDTDVKKLFGQIHESYMNPGG